MKPTVFVGSSSENQIYTLALQVGLKPYADVTVWSQGFFQPTKGFLERLMDALNETDFGAFVFAPDDVVKIRGVEHEAVRDNVLFELGLFMGKLGRERVFFIVPEALEKLRLPSDLHGVSSSSFDPDLDPKAAMASAYLDIISAIRKYGIRQDRVPQPLIETVNKPRILCTCSRQYYGLSFQKDVDLIKNETSKVASQITELHGTSSGELTDCLMENQYDIVHLCAYVNPKTGDIYFSDVDEKGETSPGAPADVLMANSFAKLIELCKTKLVILATCDSLVLGAKLARITNMIASTGFVQVDDILKWELSIYKCLSKGISLSNSFETASSMSNAPMLLLLKKDLAFTG
jgi:hypothetical protein